jgi:PAS domain S-box-containing protein
LQTDDPEFLSALLTQVPVALVAVDVSGQIRLLNPAAARLWGLTPPALPAHSEALGWCTREGVPLSAGEAPPQRALRGEHLHAERYLLQRQDGSRLGVKCDAHPLLGAEGLKGAVLVIHPLPEEASTPTTELRLTEQDSYQQLRDEFLATVSHELRTPLNAVLGWANVLRHRKLDARTTEKALETIERNARVQARLVDDLLDLGRIISGKLRVGLRPLEPRGFILAAVETVRSAAEAKGVSLEAALELPAGLMVSGDPERLQQVVWNLLANAVKFTPGGGRVQVRARAEPGQLVVEVQDSGIGISADFMPHLFERFRQAEGGPVKGQRGLGLGLALVRHLVELHGGTVSAQSQGAGQGATFRVTLPAMPTPA